MKVFMWQVSVLFLWICVCGALPPKPLIKARLQYDAHNKYPLALKALFGVSIRLQVFLEDDFTRNFIVSPLSATVVAAQLMLGTKGEFRNQIADLLSIDDIESHLNSQLITYNSNGNTTIDLPFASLHTQLAALLTDLEEKSNVMRNFKLKQKSAIFFDSDVVFKNSFRMLLKRFYSTQWFEMNFKTEALRSMTLMNNWAKKNTNGLIKQILPSPPSPRTSSIFANAIYFFAEWKVPFDEEMNRNGRFNVSLTKQVPVTYMINSFEELPYAETDSYQMISLPYLNDDLGMYIFLPKRNTKYAYNIKSFVESLDPKSVFKTIDSARPRGVVVKMPKMSLSHSFSILEELKKFYAFRHKNPTSRNNIRKRIDSFNNFTATRFDLNKDLYLTEATDIGNLRIDDIVQQVVLNVNERGTEAGVVTSSTVDYMGGQVNFLMDRPFVFFIQHEYTKATLFWGTIVNPTG